MTPCSILKWVEVFWSLYMGRRLAIPYSSEVLVTLLFERRLWERLLCKLVLAVCIWFCLQWNRRLRFWQTSVAIKAWPSTCFWRGGCGID